MVSQTVNNSNKYITSDLSHPALTFALQSAALGFPVVFLGNPDNKGKPVEDPEKAAYFVPEKYTGKTDPDSIRGLYRYACNSAKKKKGGRVTGVGWLAGNGVVFLDFDDISDSLVSVVSEHLQYPPEWVKMTPGGGVHFPVKIPDYEPPTPKSGLPLTSGGELDIIDTGNYIGAYGEHPDGGRYEDRFTLPDSDLPTITNAQLYALLDATIEPTAQPAPRQTTSAGRGAYDYYGGAWHNHEKNYQSWLSEKAYLGILDDITRALVGWDERCLFPERHKHGDKSRSAFTAPDGEPTCRSCGRYRLIDVCQRLNIDWRRHRKQHPLPRSNTAYKSPNANRHTPNGATVVTVDARWITDVVDYDQLSQHHVITVHSAMGTHKTGLFGEFADHIKAHTIETQTTLNSLNRAFVGRFRPMHFISHLEDNATLSQTDRVCTSMNSQHKTKGNGGVIPDLDLYFLDESEAQIDFLFNGTLTPSESAQSLQDMKAKANRAKHVLLADANIGIGTQAFLELVNVRSHLHIENTHRRDDLPAMEVVENTGVIHEGIARDLADGKKILTFSEDKSQVKTWQATYGSVYNTLAIHGDNSDDPDMQPALADMSATMHDFQAVFASPSIQTGVSIETEVDNVYILAPKGIITPEDLLQQAGRARHITGKIYIFLASDTDPDHHRPATPDAVKTDLWAHYTDTYNIVKHVYDGSGDLLPPEKRIDQLDKPQREHFELLCVITAKRNALMNRRKSAFIEMARAHGYTVEVRDARKPDASESAAIKVNTDIKDAVKLAIRESVIAAPELIDDTAYRIYAGQGMVTDDIRHGHELWRVLDLFGEVNNTPGTDTTRALYDWHHQHGPKVFYNYLWACSDKRTLARLDATEIDAAPGRQTGRALTYYLFRSVLAAANGLTYAHDLDNDDIEYTADNLQAAKDKMDTLRGKLKRQLGLDPTAYKSPLWAFKAFLKAFGLSLTEHPTKRGVYILDQDALSFMSTRARVKAKADTSLSLRGLFPTIPRGKKPPPVDRDKSGLSLSQNADRQPPITAPASQEVDNGGHAKVPKYTSYITGRLTRPKEQKNT